MKEFKNENEKRQFVETMLSKGLDEAKRQQVYDNQKVIIVETGKTVKIMGEALTANEAQERYPQAVVLELTAEEMNV